MVLLKQQGTSLVELMVSLTLGAIMLLGAVQILVNSKLAFIAKDAMSSAEFAGNYTLDTIANDLRVAGYQGCISKRDSIFENLIEGSSAVFQPERGIQGWEAKNTSVSDTLSQTTWGNLSAQSSGNWVTTTGKQKNIMPTTSSKAAKGSDMIRIWGMDSSVFNITSATAESLTVNSASRAGFPKQGGGKTSNDRILLVSDCVNSLIVRATDFNQYTGVITLAGNSAGTSRLASMDNAEAVILKGVQYYLGKRTTGSNPPTSLYRRRIKADGNLGSAEEIIEGIANMQIVYGESFGTGWNPGANRYVTAENVDDWQRVVSVRMWLLTETISDNVVSVAGKSYRYIGKDYTPADRRFRREMSMTISLRNRILGAMPWM